MCDATEFKLCTCGGKKLSKKKIDWVLIQKGESIPPEQIRGMFSAPPELTLHQTTIQAVIENKLNESNCFDFDYEPQEGDFLEVCANPSRTVWYFFEFTHNNWCRIDYNPHLCTEKQFKKQKKGYYTPKLDLLVPPHSEA